ncbi:hypothetical protein [Maritimibacter fusiformis]|uniref:Uncharacterized protein n=1 Tax=Maritimibacter fusiformis TaxID=2603819 RepID=A0A5D0RJ53_9RHOB|nr:hypothetical protein [Maritimibacter fusiformis]TYB81473.1 hypothetical protein FVF75_10230 [Maritimibacter fusiformis]
MEIALFTSNTNPSPELLKAVRAGLVLQGTSLSRWAEAHGVKRQNLTKALLGEWRGPKAQTLLEKVKEAALVQGGK